MTYREQNGLRIIQADEGKTLTNGHTYGDTIYLGVNALLEGWEEVDASEAEGEREKSAYTEETLQELSNAELHQILSDMGISANMNKANMIRLILAEQEVNV